MSSDQGALAHCRRRNKLVRTCGGTSRRRRSRSIFLSWPYQAPPIGNYRFLVLHGDYLGHDQIQIALGAGQTVRVGIEDCRANSFLQLIGSRFFPSDDAGSKPKLHVIFVPPELDHCSLYLLHPNSGDERFAPYEHGRQDAIDTSVEVDALPFQNFILRNIRNPAKEPSESYGTIQYGCEFFHDHAFLWNNFSTSVL